MNTVFCNMHHKLSIIVPLFNARKSLVRTVNSILQQSFVDFELILVDDGSLDNSFEICNELASRDSRIRVLHQSNKGVSAARNYGLSVAKGEWIAFADADDYVESNWLEIFANCIEEGTDIVIQGYFQKINEVEELTACGVDFTGDACSCLEELLKDSMPGALWNKCFRRDLILQHNIKMDEKIKIKEDELFVFQYMKYAHTIVCTKQGAYVYNVPIWRNKYNEINNMYCEAKLFKELRSIYNDKMTECLRMRLFRLCNCFFDYMSKDRFATPTTVALFKDAIKGMESQLPLSKMTIWMFRKVENDRFLCKMLHYKSSLMKQ